MKGAVEVLPGSNPSERFLVMDWSPHRHNGWLAATFTNRPEAVAFARAYAKIHNRELLAAVIIAFPGMRY